VLSRDLDSFEFNELKPGDLLFWTGTYDVEKDPPVTHTMIYLGEDKETGKPVMLGASDGRSFEGKRMSGVSVFDFKTASKKATSSGRHPRTNDWVAHASRVLARVAHNCEVLVTLRCSRQATHLAKFVALKQRDQQATSVPYPGV
jgi:hypothetical protein